MVAAAASCTGNVGSHGSGGAGMITGAGGSAPRADTASASGARRLSRTEIDATVRDLLGDTTNPAGRFLAEDEFTPFDNDYTRQNASTAVIHTLASRDA